MKHFTRLLIPTVLTLYLTAGASHAQGKKTIIRGSTGNGDFNADKSDTDDRLFSNTEHWFNMTGSEAGPHATKTSGSEKGRTEGDGSRHALLLNGPVFINDSGHKVAEEGEVFQIKFEFRDAHPRWHDNNDEVEVFFFTAAEGVNGYTTKDHIEEIGSVSFSTIKEDDKFEGYSDKAAYKTKADDVGKTVYVGFRAKTEAGFGRLDDFVFIVAPAR
ncbi:hypothetical protein [Haloferula sp.]|uniref:hypothetical protein n=1 Tax=Haloferula sp. TaxID=2497595 RepID=UPI00329C471E